MNNEELIQETEPHSTPNDLQKGLISAVCAGLEERLRAAGGHEEAMEIASGVCSDFDARSESAIVRSYLRDYVNSLLVKIWKTP